MSWEAGSFDIAMPHGAVKRRGHVYRGLGLYAVTKGSAKEKRPPRYSLTHLGSGHNVAWIDAPRDRAFAIATEIAEAGDWSFDALQGWRNHFPNASEKVAAILARAGGKAFRTAGGSHEGIARQIAASRA